MKIYTKGGDQGKTSLFSGTRVSKSELRLDTYGTVDELKSHIGLLAACPVNAARKDLLISIQKVLFTLGSHLACDKEDKRAMLPGMKSNFAEVLEKEIDQMEEKLTPLTYFILPGGHEHPAQAHVARAVCRRAERNIVKLAEVDQVDQVIIQYMNRLSDYLFVLSRMMAKELGVAEIPWTGKPEE